MKKLHLLILILVLPLDLFSQAVSFEKGQIITKSNDTINVLIELVPTYQGVVHYKTSSDAKIQMIKIKEIKSLKTPFNFFQNVQIKKEELLFRTVVNGKFQLYEYSKINTNPRSSTYAYGGTMTMYGPPTIIYAIKTDGSIFVLKQKKDVNQILSLCMNCPGARSIVESKTFKLEDLKSVVDNLNNCK